jgi:hypothetical protein
MAFTDKKEDLQAEVERLRTRNAELEKANKEFVERPVPQVQGFSITDSTEVRIADDAEGNPRFLYKINLPPSGGIDIKINGTSFYHDQQYEIGLDTLRSLKDVVARCWQHEQSIHGSNENFYRRPTERVLRGNGR